MDKFKPPGPRFESPAEILRFRIGSSGAVLLGNNTEAMGELRLPPSGGYAALQHYLNFVQVFNRIKEIALLRDIINVCFCYKCSLTRVFSNSMN